MEKTWKHRSEWPEVMTVKDLVECVPFLGRPRATAIMDAIGTKVGGNWAVSRNQIIQFLDGDSFWTMGAFSELKSELAQLKSKARDFLEEK